MRDFVESFVAIIVGFLLMIVALPIVIFAVAISLVGILICLALCPFYIVGQTIARIAKTSIKKLA